MTNFQRIQKRLFDFTLALLALILFGWLIVVAFIIAWLDTGMNGFFMQERIGLGGKPFKVIKIRSMRPISGVTTSVTTKNDPRISNIGRFWRNTKIDELPQLWNVLIGTMSFVGPRPDVPGFADKLRGEDRIILTIRPGITGPASLKFKNEEELLAAQENPEEYNLRVIWPEKVLINKEYIRDYRLSLDFKYILKTIIS